MPGWPSLKRVEMPQYPHSYPVHPAVESLQGMHVEGRPERPLRLLYLQQRSRCKPSTAKWLGILQHEVHVTTETPLDDLVRCWLHSSAVKPSVCRCWHLSAGNQHSGMLHPQTCHFLSMQSCTLQVCDKPFCACARYHTTIADTDTSATTTCSDQHQWAGMDFYTHRQLEDMNVRTCVGVMPLRPIWQQEGRCCHTSNELWADPGVLRMQPAILYISPYGINISPIGLLIQPVLISITPIMDSVQPQGVSVGPSLIAVSLS